MDSIKLVKILVKQSDTTTKTYIEGKSSGIPQSDLDEILRRASTIVVPPVDEFCLANLYYHHLPSNSSVIARMVPAIREWEEESLPGMAYIQCLIVTPDTLAAFGNNPVSLFKSALDTDEFYSIVSNEPFLDPIVLQQTGVTFDAELVHRLLIQSGRHMLTILLESILDTIETTFSGDILYMELLEGLFNLLPVSWRRELTFAARIVFREDWGFRAVAIPAEYTNTVERYKKGMLPYFDLDEISQNKRVYPLVDGWALLINQVLLDNRLDFLATRLLNVKFRSKETGEESVPTSETLNHLGFRWLADYTQRYGNKSNQGEAATDEDPQVPTQPDQLSDEALDDLVIDIEITEDDDTDEPLRFRTDTPREKEKFPDLLESDVPYPGHTPVMLPHELPLAQYESRNRIFSPYQRLIAAVPEHKDLFQQLDSLIGHVLTYDQTAVETLRLFWKKLHTCLDDKTLWMIREEYIHYVQTLLMPNSDEEAAPTRKSLYTLEVLDILVN